MDEEIVVLSKVYNLGNKSLNMRQEIVCVTTNEIKSKNEAVLVAFGRKENETVLLPDVWRSKISKFEKDPSI